jgi:hypothetical protein
MCDGFDIQWIPCCSLEFGSIWIKLFGNYLIVSRNEQQILVTDKRIELK